MKIPCWLAGAMALPVGAFAAPAHDGYLGETLVTASRTPIPLSEAGGGATVITRETIDRRHPQFLPDLLREVPGFAVSRAGGAGKFVQLRVRGAEANHVLVLIDGVEANDLTRADEFDFGQFTATDVERIEIVRGPQSALWGSDALAGVINIVTREADTPLRADVSTEYGSFGTSFTQAHLAGTRGAYRGSLGVGYLESGGTNVSIRGDEEDGYRNGTVNAKLGWRPTDTLSFDFSGRLTDAENAFDGDLGLGIPSDTPGVTDTLQAYTSGRARAETFEGHWLHTLTGKFTKLDNRDFDPAAFLEGRVVGTKTAVDYQTSVKFDTTGALPTSHVVTFMVEYERQRFEQRGPVTVFGNPNQNREFRTWGYAGEYRLRLFRHTVLAASGRFDDNSEFADIGTYRVSLTQAFPVSGSLLSVSHATGQKAPTFFDRYGFSSGGLFSPTFLGNSALAPEKSSGYEIGLKQPLLDERLVLSATYFNERLTDEINGFVVDPIGATATAVNLGGTSKRDGIEFAALLKPLPRLVLNASYTYLDATQLDAARGRRVDEVRRPRHQGAFSAGWTSASERLTLDLHASYSGEREDDTFLPPLFAARRVVLDDYVLVGVSGSYALTSTVALQARIENLIDEDYQDVFGFQTDGFAGFLGVRVAFERN